jgi:hypothetical protein
MKTRLQVAAVAALLALGIVAIAWLSAAEQARCAHTPDRRCRP